MGKIDWNDSTWKSLDNLKNYIRKYGNPSTNLKDMTRDELLHLAQCTEKAQTLINEGNSECAGCQKIVDECECDRCDGCYCAPVECQCAPKKVILTKILTFVIPKQNPRNDPPQIAIDPPQIAIDPPQIAIDLPQIATDSPQIATDPPALSSDIFEIAPYASVNLDENDEISILSHKIRIKLFILDKTNKYKNKNLNEDILRLMNLIVMQNHAIPPQANLVNLFTRIETLDRASQKAVLQRICAKLLYINKAN